MSTPSIYLEKFDEALLEKTLENLGLPLDYKDALLSLFEIEVEIDSNLKKSVTSKFVDALNNSDEFFRKAIREKIELFDDSFIRDMLKTVSEQDSTNWPRKKINDYRVRFKIVYEYLKESFDIPLSYAVEICDIDEVIDMENPRITAFNTAVGVTLITPSSMVTGKAKDERTDYHEHIAASLIARIYGLEYDDEDFENTKQFIERIEDEIPFGEQNFIRVRYVTDDSYSSAMILIPAIITPFQRDSLMKLDKIYKEKDVVVEDVGIFGFDPLVQKGFDIEEFTSIEDALEFLEENGKVFDYELPWQEVLPKLQTDGLGTI